MEITHDTPIPVYIQGSEEQTLARIKAWRWQFYGTEHIISVIRVITEVVSVTHNFVKKEVR